MKVAIQTIVDYSNYGNRLQNYALQQILKSYNFEVITLKNQFENPFLSKDTKNLIYKIFFMSGRIKRINTKFNKLKYNKEFIIKKKNFLDFTKKYINESISSIDENTDLLNLNDHYDLFFIGSDQVWNYEFPRFSQFDFLEGISKPKISYAASFGVSSIPDEFSSFYSKGLKNIDFISVRENAGKKIIQNLVPDKSVEVTLDPTLLLDKSNWESLISTHKKYTEPFILTYFLDKPNRNNQIYIDKIAKKYNLKIKQLSTLEDLENYVHGPDEFVNLFSQATMVFTDSFHACVFSIIFEKYFEIFERNTTLKSMNSRIDTLFTNLEVENRWHNENQIDIKSDIEYKNINRNLEYLRNQSHKFLDDAISKVKCM